MFDSFTWSGFAAEGQLLLRVFVATLLAIPLGWDRQRKERPAGLRTHMLVAAASATFMVLGEATIEAFDDDRPMVRVDPLRTLQAVVTGLGFLAAGTIFRANGRVRGLTTAASIWAASSAALCVATGHYVIGIGVTVIAWLVIVVLGYFEDDDHQHYRDQAGEEHELEHPGA